MIYKEYTPNYDQFTGIVRAIVPPIVAWLVAKGVLPTGTEGVVLAAATAVFAAVWSVFNNKSGKTIP